VGLEGRGIREASRSGLDCGARFRSPGARHCQRRRDQEQDENQHYVRAEIPQTIATTHLTRVILR